MPGQLIKEWDTSTLVKFIRDVFENDPPKFLPNLRTEELEVVRQLTVSDELVFRKDVQFHSIGGTGEPAFANSWVDWGSPYHAVGFWKDPLGFVHLRGVIKSGTVGSAAFTLPPGNRPSATVLLGTISNNAIGRVEVGSDGAVTPISPSSNVWVALDGLYFKV